MGKFIELTDIMGHKFYVNTLKIVLFCNERIKVNEHYISVKESAKEILKLINE